MSANGISTLANKELRQKAKLALAAVNRSADGNARATYDITQLPTQYAVNAITDNPNVGGLVEGRPWTSVAPGVVDTLGFFENQLDGGTYMTFNETISGVTVQAITTNFNGNPTSGSYIKINGTLIAGDQFGTAPDGTNTVPAPFRMLRGHTITILDPATGLSRSGFPKCYDTYGGAGLAAPGTAGIANDMKNAAVGDIIVMGTYDATSVSSAMRSAMTAYTGSTSTNTWSAVRISHMFLAKRRSTKYVGTIDSSVGNPFSFKVKISDNPNMAAAIANSGWILTWTDPRFDNGVFTAPQINVRTQSGSGFGAGNMTTDATHYNFTSWFGAAQIPQGTQFTIEW